MDKENGVFSKLQYKVEDLQCDLEKFENETKINLQEHTKRMNKIQSKIDDVEKDVIVLIPKMDNAIEQMKELTSTIKKASFSLITIGIGFIMWYIQSIK